MDGQWAQQKSDVHAGVDLGIPSQYNMQDLGDEFDDLLGLGQNTNMGSTGEASAAAADHRSNGNQRTAGWNNNRKRHKREQIQLLEAAFRENSHPDENQRRDLGRRLGIAEQQVKFWFQNRRSARKTQDQKRRIRELQEENEALRSAVENNNGCLTCAVHPTRQQLLVENARLREELQRANAQLRMVSDGRAEVSPNAVPSSSHALPPSSHRAFTVPMMPANNVGFVQPSSHRVVPNGMMQANNEGFVRSQRDTDAMLIDIAGRALQEFCAVVRLGMWQPTPDGDVLNLQQYAETMFPSIFGPYRVGSVVDGTRKTGDVLRTADNLVAILMDAARWSEMFPGIVASATASPIVTPSGSQQGMIQLMDAELRVLSPAVAIRKIKFVRQCQEVQPSKWAVVDVSADGILGHDGGGVPSACRLLPSGCLIEVQNSSCCKVTWIVNMEYDETTVSPLYHPLIRSGQALGACRWLASLQRQCEYLAIMHSCPDPALGDTDISPTGRKNIFEVAQRMTRSFYEAMCGPAAQPWRSVDNWRGGCGVGLERFEVAAHVVTFFAGSGAPGAVVLRATATVWLPGKPAQQVFDYLRDGYRRGEWDSLAKGSATIEEGHFTTGQLSGNTVSVLRTIAPHGTNGNLILQDARTDASCMVLAYATLDDQSMDWAMKNGGLATLSLLPSGVVILPDGNSEPLAPATSAVCSSSSTAVSHRSNTGSFVSVMYQTLLTGLPPVKPSLEAIDDAGNQLCRVIRKIKDFVQATNVVNA